MMIEAVLILGLALGAERGAPSCVTSDQRVETLIQGKRKALGGTEYCQFRIYDALSDVDGDTRPDFLVVFSVEGLGGGGNDHVQFLGVFPSAHSWKPVVAKVGKRGEQIVTGIDVTEGVMELSILEYRDTDARCCPSKSGRKRLLFRKGLIGDAP